MDWLFPWSLVCLDQSANSRQLSFSPTRTILAGVDANVRLFRWGWWCTREGVGGVRPGVKRVIKCTVATVELSRVTVVWHTNTWGRRVVGSSTHPKRVDWINWSSIREHTRNTGSNQNCARHPLGVGEECGDLQPAHQPPIFTIRPISKFDLDAPGGKFEFRSALIRSAFSELKIPFRRLDAVFRDVIVTLTRDRNSECSCT